MNGRSAPPASAALTHELHDIFENDRYPLSPRIRTLRGILAKLRPEPVREPLPPLEVYARRGERPLSEGAGPAASRERPGPTE